MNKFARLFVVAVLASASAFAQAGSPAAPAAATPTPTGPAKVGIINIQEAIVATNEGQRDLAALQKKFEPKQTELQGLNKEVTDLQNQLKTQGDKLNDDARNTLVKNIDTKQKNLQRNFEDAQTEFQGQQNEIVQRIGTKLMQVLDKYAKDNGFTVILDVSGQQSPVLWASQNTDVTQPIVTAYNAQSGVAAPPASAAGAAARPAAPSASRPAANAVKPPAGGVKKP